jgi:nucleoside-diphosphate-sugar epimerase
VLGRDGSILEGRPLGGIRALSLYGTGDQANGYPQSKWLAEKLVFRASKLGLPACVHRPGLIGGHSESGAMAKDVFFHFLSDVVKTRQVPDMEGDKFNITPVDWVAKSIVQIAMAPEGAAPKGNTFPPRCAEERGHNGDAGSFPGGGWIFQTAQGRLLGVA